MTRTIVRRLHGSPWLVSFCLFSALGLVWLLATPLFGSPDEPSHVLRAASVARGQFVGHPRDGTPDYFQFVTAPAGLVKPGMHPPADPRAYIPCFALDGRIIPTCFGSLPHRSGNLTVPTDVGLDPPAYYAMVGLPSLAAPGHPSLTVYLMRLVSVLACSALLASALLSVRSVRPSWLGASGLAFALTPTTVFLASVVNPNGFEICAGIGAWASVAVLAHDAETHIDPKVVRRASIAMIALALSRSLSPLWLGLIVLTGLALATRAGCRRLLNSTCVRRWAFAVSASAAVSVIFLVVENPLGHLTGHGPVPPASFSIPTIFRISFGSSGDLYRQMIGVFGWLDTGSPTLTYLLWTAGLAILVGGCVALAARRYATVAAGLVALVIVVPVAIDTWDARRVGIGWEGRWTLPFAVGVPIVAALALAWDRRQRLLSRSRLPIVLAGAFVVAHFLSFGQYLRRNTVGVAGPLDFWLHPVWSPPLPAWLLLGANLAALVVLARWIWRPDDSVQRSPAEPARSDLPSGAVRST